MMSRIACLILVSALTACETAPPVDPAHGDPPAPANGPRVSLSFDVLDDTLSGAILPARVAMSATAPIARLHITARAAAPAGAAEYELLNDTSAVRRRSVSPGPDTAWYELQAASLGDGGYTVTVTATDENGRSTAASRPLVVSIPSLPYHLRLLESLGGDAVAYGANDLGDVVGAASTGPGGVRHAVLWRGGTVHVLPQATSDSLGSSADVVTADGLLVGGSVQIQLPGRGTFCRRAMVWIDPDAPPARQPPASASACAPYFEGALQMNDRGTVLLDESLWRADGTLARLASPPAGATPLVLDGHDVAYAWYYPNPYQSPHTQSTIQLTTTAATNIDCVGPITELFQRGTICVPVGASERGDVLFAAGSNDAPLVREASGASGNWYDLSRATGVAAGRFFPDALTAIGRGGHVVALNSATGKALLWRNGLLRRVDIHDLADWQLMGVRAPSAGARVPVTVRRRGTSEMRAAVLEPGP